MVEDVTIPKTRKAPLTALEVNRLKPPAAGRLNVRDPGCRGLVLRITASGVKTWSLSVKIDGRQRRFTIGDAATMSSDTRN
jgi:hypothetical protein